MEDLKSKLEKLIVDDPKEHAKSRKGLSEKHRLENANEEAEINEFIESQMKDPLPSGLFVKASFNLSDLFSPHL